MFGDIIIPVGILAALFVFLYVNYRLQIKATQQQSNAYNDYLKDSMSVLEENNKCLNRIADILEKKYNGK